MLRHQQTIFYAEYLHTDWLASDQQRTVMWLTTRLPTIGIGVCISLLVSLAVGGITSLMLFLQMGLLRSVSSSILTLLKSGQDQY